MTTASIRKLFAELRRELVPMRARDRRAAAGRRPLPARRFDEARAARFRPRSVARADRLRPRSRPPRQDPSSVLHQVLDRRRAHHHPRVRGRHRRRRCSRPCTRPAMRSTSRASMPALEGTPLGTRHFIRRAREPVAAVGERGRPQPRVLGALLIRSCSGRFRTSSARCRSTPSIAPSTRSSAR